MASKTATRNKFVAIVAILSVALVATIATMIVVLVTANQNATSAVNVKYTAQEVYVRLSANAYVGATTYTFKEGGSATGNTHIDLSPTDNTGELSQVDSEITISKEIGAIVFEYRFENLTEDIDACINLSLGLVQENFILGYYIPEKGEANKLTNYSDIPTISTYPSEGVLLGAYSDENSMDRVQYIYIVASIENPLYNSSLTGNFNWALSKTESVELQFSLGNSDLGLLGSASMVNKYFANSFIYEPQWLDAENKRFNGWYLDANYTTPATFPMVLTADTMLHPHYQDANLLDSSYYQYDSASDSYFVIGCLDSSFLYTDLIIPDVYDGPQGIRKVTQIINSDANTIDYYNIGLIYYANVTHAYLGNYITRVEQLAGTDWDFADCNRSLRFVEFGRSTEYISGYALVSAPLTTLRLPNSVKTITTYYQSGYGYDLSMMYGNTSIDPIIQCYNDTTSYVLINGENIVNTNNVANWNNVICISRGCFAYMDDEADWDEKQKSNLTTFTFPTKMEIITINGVFYGCSSLTSITIPSSVPSLGNSAFYNCSSLTSITIPSSVTSIGHSAFYNCSSLTSITIPSSVTSIGTYAFYGCTSLTSITFEDTTTWQKASNSAFTANVSTADVSNPTQNATWLTSTSGYMNYYWRKI